MFSSKSAIVLVLIVLVAASGLGLASAGRGSATGSSSSSLVATSDNQDQVNKLLRLHFSESATGDPESAAKVAILRELAQTSADKCKQRQLKQLVGQLDSIRDETVNLKEYTDHYLSLQVKLCEPALDSLIDEAKLALKQNNKSLRYLSRLRNIVDEAKVFGPSAATADTNNDIAISEMARILVTMLKDLGFALPAKQTLDSDKSAIKQLINVSLMDEMETVREYLKEVKAYYQVLAKLSPSSLASFQDNSIRWLLLIAIEELIAENGPVLVGKAAALGVLPRSKEYLVDIKIDNGRRKLVVSPEAETDPESGLNLLADLANYSEAKCSSELLHKTYIQLVNQQLRYPPTLDNNELDAYWLKHVTKQLQLCQTAFDKLFSEAISNLNDQDGGRWLEQLVELRDTILTMVGHKVASSKQPSDLDWVDSELVGKAVAKYLIKSGVHPEAAGSPSNRIRVEQISALIGQQFEDLLPIARDRLARARNLFWLLRSSHGQGPIVETFRQDQLEKTLLIVIMDRLSFESQNVARHTVKHLSVLEPKKRRSLTGLIKDCFRGQ